MMQNSATVLYCWNICLSLKVCTVFECCSVLYLLTCKMSSLQLLLEIYVIFSTMTQFLPFVLHVLQ